MRTRTFVAVIMVLLLQGFTSIVAQEEQAIEYGQTVSGEITNRDFEIPFSFEGSEGDVLIIVMKPVETLGDLSLPEIILLDSEGEIVGDTSANFTFGGARLAIELGKDDSYIILATRNDGRAGDSIGEFTLELIKPVTLSPEEPISDSVTTGTRNNYYLIQSNSKSFALIYKFQDGDFFPQVALTRIEGTDLIEVALLSGEELVEGQLTIRGKNAPYIVSVGEAPLDFNFGEKTANYELNVAIAE